MNLFDVYPLYDVKPSSAKDVYVYDNQGGKYLDLYGGHAVISIGHSHPHYVKQIKDQLDQIAFYSNAIQNPLQKRLADAIGEHSSLDNFFFSVCMTKTGEARECGEFWFLVPPANSSLDKRDKDHRVLLLVDKEEYDTNSEVIVYVPTSHVLLHQVVIMIVNYML